MCVCEGLCRDSYLLLAPLGVQVCCALLVGSVLASAIYRDSYLRCASQVPFVFVLLPSNIFAYTQAHAVTLQQIMDDFLCCSFPVVLTITAPVAGVDIEVDTEAAKVAAVHIGLGHAPSPPSHPPVQVPTHNGSRLC